MTPKKIRSRRLAPALSVEELARELRVDADLVRALGNGDDPASPPRDVLERVFGRLEAASQEK